MTRPRLNEKRKRPGGQPQPEGIYGLPAEDDDVEFFGSGSKLLDLALGGGWAERRVSNIIGDSSTGKTLLAVEAGTNFLRKHPKGKVRYRETESAFSMSYARDKLGMPVDKFDFGSSNEPVRTIEEIYEELAYRTEVASSPNPELMIIDSLDALSSRAELARSIDQGSYGAEKAKQMSALFRRINSAMAAKHITMMIISQTRDKIGVMYGRKWTSSGGRAKKFYSSQDVVLSQGDKIYKTVQGQKYVIGIETRALIDKNKVGPAFREVFLPILFGFGVDDERSCLDWLAKHKHKVNGKASLAELHQAVSKHWQEIEQALAPNRRKYE